MEKFSFMLAAAFIVYAMINVVIKPAREIKILEDKVSLENKSSAIVAEKNTEDFYGTKLMKINPRVFLQILEETINAQDIEKDCLNGSEILSSHLKQRSKRFFS
ncbi:MAG TPA: hypothetical protein PLM93_11455 [Sulfuricurvum sp.]|nr:MAG: hypothetical protein B7Y30_06750 [Campylobacterales bacterium 16-40-21]OZA02199.1 MAG: hypothetical protein B7X89_10215 [Sulfuricurvum sp. 17-40-25]HQS67790.1 hypothetical protein [Sulfuricurvum sp.]HQT36313.1 hypothetical protein [Sulfuricurvum sp.]